MSLVIALVCGLSLFVALTHRTWLGVVCALQLLFGAVVVALVSLFAQAQGGVATESVSAFAVQKAHSLGLAVMIFSQLQALLALGFAVRLHYLRIKPNMTELRSMRN